MLTPDPAARVSDNPAFRRMFAPGRLTLGAFFPIESYERDEPRMRDQERLARRAEELGYAALWVRDVPLRDPSFGDLGQVYDPWVYLGWIAAHTSTVALATGSIVLPLRHPLHTAKAAASIDRLTGGRLVLGVASGDRPVEFPVFGVPFDDRAALFREHLRVLREALTTSVPAADLVPKPIGRIPVLVTGHSGQDFDWIAEHADGWLTYPRPVNRQAELAATWRKAVDARATRAFKPFAQSFYVDLAADPGSPPEPLHLGFRAGRNVLLQFLETLRFIGVHHVALNFKYARRPAGDLLEEIGAHVLPALEAGQRVSAA